MRILALMSGGLDSTMAAARLLDQGHEVVAVTFRMLSGQADEGAARMAETLGIEHHVIDLAEAFEARILAPFADSYASGLTPNPCVVCNPQLKLTEGMAAADRLGCDRLATGHYARVERAEGGPILRRGADPAKDQSYFLYRLPPEVLSRLELPLGACLKSEVREKARTMGLPVWERPESQDVCFAGLGSIAEVVEARRPDAGEPGEIVDESGRVLGSHEGIARYTVGQRRGLGIGGGPPLYVLGIEAQARRVVVGERERLVTRGLSLESCHWLHAPEGTDLAAVCRYRAKPVACRVRVAGDGAAVELDQPVYGAAPGQSAVVYDGDRVLGGGFIAPSQGN
ncbi:MAG: tRNA 2-thiouridine(34) synthase MnmA [Armatimonadia bacterium]|nr:tRNA 2-thiouridine(34) synthase MnmA [Armatimonadia bacterium]